MKVGLNWTDYGFGGDSRRARKPRPAAAPKPAPAPAPAPARRPAAPRPQKPVRAAAPQKARVLVPLREGWAPATFQVALEGGKRQVVEGEVLHPAKVWGVCLLEGRGMLIYLPVGGLLCDGPSVNGLRSAAEKIRDVGPGWASAECAKVAAAVLSRKSVKTPAWWKQARDAVNEVCP